jgi:hypothetical protein
VGHTTLRDTGRSGPHGAGRLARGASWLVVALALPGCFLANRAVEVRLINHSGAAIDTDLGGERTRLDEGQSARIEGSGRTPTFEVVTPARTWRYDLLYPAGDAYRANVTRSPFHTRHDRIALQLEPSGGIYVVPPASTAASRPFDPQPAGFPLLPIGPR